MGVRAQATQGEVTGRGLFLSYRRDDSAETTGRIADRLREAFGNDAVFLDVDSIPTAVDFRVYLRHQIERCAALLVIVGPRWLATSPGASLPRLHEEGDLVRAEIETALQAGVPVVPVLVQRAAMPPERSLPSALKEFAFRNAAAARPDPDFRRDMDRLIATLRSEYGLQLTERARVQVADDVRALGFRGSQRTLTLGILVSQVLQVGLFWSTEADDVRLVAVLIPNLLGAALAFLGWRSKNWAPMAFGVLALLLPWVLRGFSSPEVAISAAALVVCAVGLVALGRPTAAV